MIVLDTSALIAALAGEPQAPAVLDVLERSEAFAISAGTLAEACIVAGRKRLTEELFELLGRLGVEIVPVDAAAARRVGEAHARWGRGVHPAALNFGDCFAYALAAERRAPLLFVGEDFARTDARAALG